MNVAAPRIYDKRALLAAVSRRKVRALAAESNEFAAALFGVAHERAGFGARVEHNAWLAVLAELDACELTVGEYLEQEVRR